MPQVTLYGAPYSVYVRIARLVLEEAAVSYDLAEVDIFAEEGISADYLERQPFGKIPAFEHDGFRLYETDAIAHYVMEAFGKADLMPEAPQPRARARQIMRILDSYAYPWLVWGVYVPEKEEDRAGKLAADEIERAQRVLRVLEDLMAQPFFMGFDATLADLWAAPMLTYLSYAPTGQRLLSEAPKLSRWLDTISRRPSLQATQFPREEGQAG